ncbi:MAG: PEGA domain-containing protein [Vulcanimicrobiota bacterium]
MIPVEPPPSRPEPKEKPKKKFSAVRAGVLTAVASAALVGWWFNAKKQVEVAPDPPQAVIGSVPAGAKIFAGAEVVGQTPLVVVQGQYDTVTLKMDGYQDKTVGLEFSERKVNRMLETLDPSLGQVALKGVPKDAKISLDGAEPVAVGAMTTDWPMGTHKVKVILSDQEPAEFEVTVSKDSAVDLGAEVEKIVSVRPRLLLTVSGPAKFNVEVSKVGHENIQAASGAGNLSLPLQDGRGIYKISVTADGYLGYNKDIEIAGPRKMSVVLQPRPAPAPAPAPVSSGTGGGGFRPAPAPPGGSGGHRISAPDF